MSEKVSFVTVNLCIGLVLIVWPALVAAQGPSYQGKTIRILVGYSAGGRYDTYSRLIAKHLGKHIPGNPNIVVENMTGAGGLIAANHLFNVAKPDGLTIGIFGRGPIFSEIIGERAARFDAQRFEWIGAPVREHGVCISTKQTDIRSIEQWIASKRPVKVGATSRGSLTYLTPLILKEALDLPVQLVSGYSGTANLRRAVQAGELEGLCGLSWALTKASWGEAINSGDLTVVLQIAPKSHPDLPHVPLAVELAKSVRAQKLIQVGIQGPDAIAFAYSLPPGTPEGRVNTLRRAFQATMNDRDFLADARRSKLDIDPLTGEDVGKIVRDSFDLEPALVASLRRTLAGSSSPPVSAPPPAPSPPVYSPAPTPAPRRPGPPPMPKPAPPLPCRACGVVFTGTPGLKANAKLSSSWISRYPFRTRFISTCRLMHMRP